MEKVLELPFTSLSKLLRDALADLRLCESQPDKYGINMSCWLWFGDDPKEPDEKCLVCLAGSVIANRIDCGKLIDYISDPDWKQENGRTREFTPHEMMNIPEYGRTWRHLRALNCLREGYVLDAIRFSYGQESCSEIGICSFKSVNRIAVTEYETDREQFHADMQRIAANLEAVGM